MPKLHVKKGDLVQVIAGKDKGAKGRVIRALPREQRVVVEGVNLIKKHSKVTHQGPRGAKEGGVLTMEAPIHVSNVKKLKDDEKAEKPEKKAAAKGDTTEATGEDK
ncbi:MAG: 50S ribosomal protein L24 [Actinomycetales bacterium]|uniref:Large ribosomal subunit protein uL24 n=1 Tax=Thermobispora bispora (strain ATCC 19993 / DSM 43833 / CBS 139.67 / JCM 10125 / KCTC 9307 / NBRC 14880 / R51) TaxID=469371 RepID=D6Y525_THEBD|nr:ribosomal protein L24 [Thermobispora bispora DSM 43833]